MMARREGIIQNFVIWTLILVSSFAIPISRLRANHSQPAALSARLPTMRIIAGKHRGRKFLPPEGDVTRPITDRVKQSLFDILAPLLPEARIYDCFAGTGSMGLECLSRGAAQVLFFESDRSALARLKTNIAAMDDEHHCRILPGDLFHWFEKKNTPDEAKRANLIFLDPPYRFVRDQPDALVRLAERFAHKHLAIGGTVVFRHDAADALELAPLQRYDHREYGDMTLEFLNFPNANQVPILRPD